MVNRRVGSMRKDKGGDKKDGFFSRYRPPPADYVKRQAERKGGKFDSIFKGNFDTFTPKEGDNTLRVLPAGWEGSDDYAYQVWIHYGIGADESSYLCLRKMKDETCPICQEVARMKADGETEDAKRIDCKERFICWVIDRSDRDETPALYSMPATVYKDINALCYSSKSGKAIFIDNPDDGYDIIVRRTGTKRNTRYLPQVDREATAVTDDPDKYKELEEWVQDNQVPECLQFFDADYLEKALSGEIDRNKDDQDEDDKDVKRPARRGRDDEDDEDDAKPARTKRRGRDEEEDEDEDRPARGKGKAAAAKDEDDLDDELPFGDDEDEDESENEAKEARQDRQARSSRRDRDEDEDGTDERPRANKRPSRRDEDDEEDEDPPPRRRGREEDEGDEEESPPRGRTRTRDRAAGNRRV
jgi:gp32 DNA binding protein like